MRSCLRSLLKLMNSIIGMVATGMILYSLWMIRLWHKHLDGGGSISQIPWFIYTFLGLGISLCLITCSGHIAAETADGHCLSCYMVIVFLVVLLEAAVTADVFLNRNWEEDFLEDPTGRFEEFKKFVRSNFEMCKWIGSLIREFIRAIESQGSKHGRWLGTLGCLSKLDPAHFGQLFCALSILLAMILRALGPDPGGYYDSDDDYTPARLPFLKPPVQQPPYAVYSHFKLKNDVWNKNR